MHLSSRFHVEARAFLAAVALLTRLPIDRRVRIDETDLRRSGTAFPFVGACLGAATGGVAYGLARVLPPLSAAAVAVGVGAVLTGALHMDGLADTADGLGASSREQALIAMRDHAVGAYGASALALDIMLKAAALTALAPRAHVVALAAAAGALSRAAPVATATLLPYARPDEGTGRPLTDTSRGRALMTLLVGVTLAVALADWHGAVLAAVAGAVTIWLSLLWRSWLGGVTGDTLGATVEAVEIASLLAAAALVT